MLEAIVGINWGDEGKGRMVDLLAGEFDVVCRYQGGNNAGHTVVNERGKFILNLLPSGILRDGVVNVMGAGMVIDLGHLAGEIDRLVEKGVSVTPKNLKISDKAVLVLPYHVAQDCLEEDRLADAKYGSTRRGIAPVYGDKYLKKVLRAGDLVYLSRTELKNKLAGLIEWKNLLFSGYGAKKIEFEQIFAWLMPLAERFKDYVADTSAYLTEIAEKGKKIMFEAQLGALRDIDFGIFPYTSSSSTISAYAPIGAGVPQLKVDSTIGIMKAYSSCVGEGPFVAELFGAEAELIRQEGAEYGAATGRPRRVGGFDVPASRYGVRAQGANQLALTKLDVLSALKEIPVTVAYECAGKQFTEFPYPAILDKCKPVNKYLKGWCCDIGGAKKWEDLPKEAKEYVRFIENAVGAKMKYISVGAERNQYVLCD